MRRRNLSIPPHHPVVGIKARPYWDPAASGRILRLAYRSSEGREQIAW